MIFSHPVFPCIQAGIGLSVGDYSLFGMKFFLKIGVPWALSMGLAFFLGGRFLGDSDGSTSFGDSKGSGQDKGSVRANSSSRDSVPENSGSGSNIGNPSAPEETESTARASTPSPPLPPNLRRIMKGRDIISRLGSYLDAVRAMDGSNVNEVVTAFEELPKGYGRHLEMKLLMSFGC